MVALRRELTCMQLSSVNAINTNLFLSGPLISPAAKERVTSLIASVEDEGGKIHLDGRNIRVPGYPDGNFVGPTIVETLVTMKAYQ
jgi:acyl-CoA reductase-like NAD-dependent aldehyde dehydrogenase